MVKKRKLKVLSLFSGCGGMDIGFEGGFICHKKSIPNKFVQEIVDENWVKTKKLRFTTVFANDILNEAKIVWSNYMKRFGLTESIYHIDSIVELVKRHKNGEQIFPSDIDIVTGGFPCQDFSVAGKRKGFDSNKDHFGKTRNSNEPSEETRGKLYYWMKQVIEITKPKIFIAENVKGLVNLGDIKDIIQKDFSSADKDGYIVLPPQVLHAANFGVPESRERVIFIGIRKSALNKSVLDVLSSDSIPTKLSPYPPQTHAYSFTDPSLLPVVVCKDIFSSLPEPEYSDDLSHMIYSKAKYMGTHCQGQKEIKLDGIGPTIRSEHHGNIEFRRLSEENGGLLLEELNKGLQERRLSPRECALIQTFPPDCEFVIKNSNSNRMKVSSSSAYKIIGNAVPPILAYNIANRIQELWHIYFNNENE